MKFRRRSEAAEPADRPAAPAASADRVAAAFAGILDGRRLWVAVDARSGGVRGTIGLRDTATGLLVAAPDDDAGDQPGYLAARLDLTALPEAPGGYDVVLVSPGAGGATPLWSPPLPPHRTPPAPDGASRFVLARTDGQTLRVRRERVDAAVLLDAVHVDAGADVVLRFAGTGAALRLVTDDGVELAAWPVQAGTAVLGAAPPGRLDGVAPLVARFLLDEVPVRRRDHDLAEPARAVPLPEVGRLRLRWSNPGLLQARILEEPQEGDA